LKTYFLTLLTYTGVIAFEPGVGVKEVQEKPDYAGYDVTIYTYTHLTNNIKNPPVSSSN